MHRSIITAATAALFLFAGSGVAQAQDPEEKVPPAFSPPAPAPVVDQASAEAFMEGYAAQNAGRFLRQDRRRVRVFDVNAACLEHPVIADRFGCVFTLRAAVILRRSRGWDGWDHKAATPASRGKGRPRFRIRNYGCLGLARVIGGPTVTPSVTVPLVECARVPRGDYDAPEPVR